LAFLGSSRIFQTQRSRTTHCSSQLKQLACQPAAATIA
jgi:hypothetical protein